MDHASFRYQIEGSMATGFRLVDTMSGVVVGRYDERVDANRAYADANRTWHTKGIAK